VWRLLRQPLVNALLETRDCVVKFAKGRDSAWCPAGGRHFELRPISQREDEIPVLDQVAPRLTRSFRRFDRLAQTTHEAKKWLLRQMLQQDWFVRAGDTARINRPDRR
jgi:hypothetical protein